MKLGKRFRAANEAVGADKLSDLGAALEKLKATTTAKFDETVENATGQAQFLGRGGRQERRLEMVVELDAAAPDKSGVFGQQASEPGMVLGGQVPRNDGP
jgi:ribosomal protein L1